MPRFKSRQALNQKFTIYDLRFTRLLCRDWPVEFVSHEDVHITIPPSTVSTWPVMYREAGPARNSAACAISSGWPRRFNGIFFNNSAFNSALNAAVMSV